MPSITKAIERQQQQKYRVGVCRYWYSKIVKRQAATVGFSLFDDLFEIKSFVVKWSFLWFVLHLCGQFTWLFFCEWSPYPPMSIIFWYFTLMRSCLFSCKGSPCWWVLSYRDPYWIVCLGCPVGFISTGLPLHSSGWGLQEEHLPNRPRHRGGQVG